MGDLLVKIKYVYLFLETLSSSIQNAAFTTLDKPSKVKSDDLENKKENG